MPRDTPCNGNIHIIYRFLQIPIVQVKSPEGKFQKTSTGAVRMQPKSEELKFVTKNDGYVHIHPSSVNYQVRMMGCTYICMSQVLGWQAQSLKFSQTLFYHLLSAAHHWAREGWVSINRQEIGLFLEKTFHFNKILLGTRQCSRLLSDVKLFLCITESMP